MRTALKQLKAWIDADIMPITVSVNLTGKQLQQDNFTAVLKEIIKDTGLRADYLELEITESMIIKDLDVALGILKD
jgi:EAL domain-containing protein (putative c-di-GMP-specific phosphodiesterase class I)